MNADLLDGHRMVLLAGQTETNHKKEEDDDIKKKKKKEPIKLGSQLGINQVESEYTQQPHLARTRVLCIPFLIVDWEALSSGMVDSTKRL